MSLIAELNIGRLVAPPDSPEVAEFMANLDRINGLGKRSPGFVWIMEGETPGAGNTENIIGDDPLEVANLTVWDTVASLRHFVFNTLHKQFMHRRAEWFISPDQPFFVMWEIDEGHIPSMKEALERLEHLRAHGSTQHAFGWDFVVETVE